MKFFQKNSKSYVVEQIRSLWQHMKSQKTLCIDKLDVAVYAAQCYGGISPHRSSGVQGYELNALVD